MTVPVKACQILEEDIWRQRDYTNLQAAHARLRRVPGLESLRMAYPLPSAEIHDCFGEMLLISLELSDSISI
jgi:hypothetical protein